MIAAGKSIFIVGVDTETSQQLSDVLSQEGYNVTAIHLGREALDYPYKIPDLIILATHLSDMNGLDFLRTVKQQPAWPDVPVFILSYNESEVDEIISLEVGADDFIAKPVQIPRLKARIHALFRRRDQQLTARDMENDVITIDDLSILVPQLAVVCGEEHIELSKKEFEILVQLAKNHGRVLTRQALFQSIWGHHDSSANRTIDVHIGRIRKKLKGYAHYIETVPSVGYRFKENQVGE